MGNPVIQMPFTRLAGVEIEAEHGDPEGIQLLVPKCGIARDGSLGNTGIEIQTPPSSGDKLVDVIRQACDALYRCDYEITSECGLHVHVEAEDLADEQLNALITMVSVWEPTIFACLPYSRRTNQYCGGIKDRSDRLNQQLKAGAKTKDAWGYSFDRYRGLNLHALEKWGTVEFRYHCGTTNPEKILAWTRLCVGLVNWATRHKRQECGGGSYQAVVTRNNYLEHHQKRMGHLLSLLHLTKDRAYWFDRIKQFAPPSYDEGSN